MDNTAATSDNRHLMKFLFDLFPIILFFIAYKWLGIFAATAVAIGATFLQIGWVWFRHRKVDNMLWVSLGVIVVFGGATLLFHDETFIKWKPTVLYALFGLTLLVAQFGFGKNFIKTMMEKQMTLPDAVWLKVMYSWVGFFFLMGVLNLYVAFNYSTDAWVNFKMFGGLGLMLVFIVLQALMLAKYVDSEPTK